MKAKLDEWNAEIDLLSAKADAAHADSRIAYQKQMETLRRRREEAGAKLKELQTASEDAWESLRKGMESAWDAMSEAMKDAASRFK
ncbi:MAG TPA: coiled coil domain-containing protein [Burkholderiales bacterium]|nr:coiled coil domain-containing protein [Burkholderiales bacterium]